MGRKDFLHKICKVYTMPLAYLGRIDSRMFGENIYLAIAKICDKYNKKYHYSTVLTPRLGGRERDLSINTANIAIVMQGPVCMEENFTLETVRYYRYIYPNVKIIISTWKGTSTEFIEACKKYCTDILLNDEPLQKDSHNMNYQLKSSLAGVEYAKKLGVQYVLKSRTDQRVLKYDTLGHFLDLLKLFPKKGDADLKSRLIFFGDEWNTAKYIPFFVCDFFSFGHINDLMKLYSIPMNESSADKRKTDEIFWGMVKEFNEKKLMQTDILLDDQIENYREKIKRVLENVPEQYIIWNFHREYISRLDVTKDDLLSRYWLFLKQYCIIVDNNCLDFYWQKYDSRYLSKPKEYMWMNFPAWLKLYMNNEKEFMGKE